MQTHPLTRRSSHVSQPTLSVVGEMTLVLGRLHEFCGNARHMLALMTAAATQGPVFWIAPEWSADKLNPDGMAALVGPERFTFISPRQPRDLLWTLEEVLRSGAVPLAVAELPDLPSLTAVRRLHLAAERGGQTGRGVPIGLILTPGEGGAPGIESRWHLSPRHGPQNRAWALSRLRARTQPQKDWILTRSKNRFVLNKRAHEDVNAL
ncbi:MAG: hypothetical protein AAGK67_02855 [Pseudomonadota bacterium]